MADFDPDHLLARFERLPASAPLLAALGRIQDDVYLVGGAVRDLICEREPVDLDFIVPGPVGGLADALGVPVRSHDRFGTASAGTDGHRYDLARTRTERYEHPGALPTVAPGTLDQDLARRDFTVNAIALGLTGAVRGRLAAAPHAREDLMHGRLRVLHDTSFRDDPTRLLRLARYAARLGFEVEPHTEGLARAAVAGGALTTVSGNRLGAELQLLAAEPDPFAGLRSLTELGVAEALTPGFGLDPDGEEVARRAQALLGAEGAAGRLALAAAALGVSPRALAALADRLALPADVRALILAAPAAPGLAARLAAADSATAIAASVAVPPAVPVEIVALAGALGAPDAARRWLHDLRGITLEINGTDLIAAGVPAGPRIGQAMRAALAAKREGRAGDREAELAAALAAVGGRDARD